MYLLYKITKQQKRADERAAQEQANFERRMQFLEESNANMPKPPEVTPFQESLLPDSGSSTKSSGSPISSGNQCYRWSRSKVLVEKCLLKVRQDLAVQAGFSPENAKIMAAIGMGESGGDSRIDTVQMDLTLVKIMSTH